MIWIPVRIIGYPAPSAPGETPCMAEAFPLKSTRMSGRNTGGTFDGSRKGSTSPWPDWELTTEKGLGWKKRGAETIEQADRGRPGAMARATSEMRVARRDWFCTLTLVATRFQAVVFDMDGVIVDSEPLHERAFREVFTQIGLGDTHGIHFPAYSGRSDKVLWDDFIDRHRPAQSLEALSDWKQDLLIRMIREEQPLYPSLPECVEALASRYPLAVASGSLHKTINAVLELRDLRRFFSVVASSQDVKRSKPAPDVFLHAAGLLGLPPEACCVIEDSVAGVEAGLAAGMTVIAITNSASPERLHRAHHIVKTYEEVKTLLL